MMLGGPHPEPDGLWLLEGMLGAWEAPTTARAAAPWADRRAPWPISLSAKAF